MDRDQVTEPPRRSVARAAAYWIMGFGLGRRRSVLLLAPLVLLGVAAAATLLRSAPASADVYVPKSDGEVLETLPGPVAKTWLRTPAEASSSAPLDEASAVLRARAELTLYQESADPRYLGRAEAALSDWWDQASPPEPVLVLRARIRQSNHDFLTALTDLDRALELRPSDAQALLDRASIQTVLGRYDGARHDCQALESLTAPLYVVVCRAAIDGVTGRAGAALAELSHALSSPQLEVEDRCWAESLQGELAARLGDDAQAEAHFRGVLAGCPNDSYARGALADLLLDLNRYSEVVSLLADSTRQDALLLRLTIAERQLRSPNFDSHLKDLEQRFEEARLRGSQVHRREEARFELSLKDSPGRALSLAIANFEVQREPADVRVALSSALAAGSPERVSQVLRFVNDSKLEDVHVAALVARLRP